MLTEIFQEWFDRGFELIGFGEIWMIRHHVTRDERATMAPSAKTNLQLPEEEVEELL